MATFRSGVKILGQVSRNQGRGAVRLRSYSDDRKTSHRHQYPEWAVKESGTTCSDEVQPEEVRPSRSWFSLFRRQASPDKIVRSGSCQMKEPEEDSWLSYFKRKVPKEKPPISSCRMYQAQQKKIEEEQALKEGREPDFWKPAVTIVNEESGNPVICQPPPEPQPQPPPQPTPPRAVICCKIQNEKLSQQKDKNLDPTSSMNKFKIRLPYDEFKVPDIPKPPNPIFCEKLQPRKQTRFVPCTKYPIADLKVQHSAQTKKNCKCTSSSPKTENSQSLKQKCSSETNEKSVGTNEIKCSQSNDFPASQKTIMAKGSNISAFSPNASQKKTDTSIPVRNFTTRETGDSLNINRYHNISNPTVKMSQQIITGNMPKQESLQKKSKSTYISSAEHNISKNYTKEYAVTGKNTQEKNAKGALMTKQQTTTPYKVSSIPILNMKETLQSVPDSIPEPIHPDLMTGAQVIMTARKHTINKETEVPQKLLSNPKKSEKTTQKIKAGVANASQIPKKAMTKISPSRLSLPNIAILGNYTAAKVIQRQGNTSQGVSRLSGSLSLIDLRQKKQEEHRSLLEKGSNTSLKVDTNITNFSYRKKKQNNLIPKKYKHFMSNNNVLKSPRKPLNSSHTENLKIPSKENSNWIIPTVNSDLPKPFITPRNELKTWNTDMSKELDLVRQKIKHSLNKSPIQTQLSRKDDLSKEPWFTECQKKYIDTEETNKISKKPQTVLKKSNSDHYNIRKSNIQSIPDRSEQRENTFLEHERNMLQLRNKWNKKKETSIKYKDVSDHKKEASTPALSKSGSSFLHEDLLLQQEISRSRNRSRLACNKTETNNSSLNNSEGGTQRNKINECKSVPKPEIKLNKEEYSIEEPQCPRPHPTPPPICEKKQKSSCVKNKTKKTTSCNAEKTKKEKSPCKKGDNPGTNESFVLRKDDNAGVLNCQEPKFFSSVKDEQSFYKNKSVCDDLNPSITKAEESDCNNDEIYSLCQFPQSLNSAIVVEQHNDMITPPLEEPLNKADVENTNTDLQSYFIYTSESIQKDIPFSYEKSYGQWYTTESNKQEYIEEEDMCSPWHQMVGNVKTVYAPHPKPYGSATCFSGVICHAIQVPKRSFSSFRIETPSFGKRVPMECSSKKGKSQPPSTDRTCKKIDSGVTKKDAAVKTCDKISAPGCRVPDHVDCRATQKGFADCKKKLAPKPSYSECVKDPTPPRKYSECRLGKLRSCPSDNAKKKNYDACNPDPEPEGQCLGGQQSEKKKKGGGVSWLDDCKDDKADDCDPPGKYGRSPFLKPAMKCASTRNLLPQQNQSITRSYSYSTSLQNKENRHLKQTYSYSISEPPALTPKPTIECSSKGGSSKSKPPSTDRTCRKIDSGVSKSSKEQKKCDKITAPGCRVPAQTDCKIKPKVVAQCKKKMAPKPSFSECLREPPPPPQYTECNLDKIPQCPTELKKKSYDGCNPDNNENKLIGSCPQEEKKGKKKGGGVSWSEECKDGEKDECDPPGKYGRSPFSKPPMKCASTKNLLSQQNQSIKRSYSNFNLQSPPQYMEHERFKQPYSYNLFDTTGLTTRTAVEYSNKRSTKSQPPQTDYICNRIVSGVHKTIKDEKVFDKIPIPSYRITENTDGKIKPQVFTDYKKKVAPKPSFSEYLKEPQLDSHYNECKPGKQHSCPSARIFCGGCNIDFNQKEFVSPYPVPAAEKIPSERKTDEKLKKEEKDFAFKPGFGSQRW